MTLGRSSFRAMSRVFHQRYLGFHAGCDPAGQARSAIPVRVFGRRLVALILDWGACLLVSYAFFDANPWATLLIFASLRVLTVGTVGASPAQRLLGLKITRLDGEWAGPVRALIRTALLCLFVPAVLQADGRGLHDVAAGTTIGPWTPARPVTTATPRENG